MLHSNGRGRKPLLPILFLNQHEALEFAKVLLEIQWRQVHERLDYLWRAVIGTLAIIVRFVIDVAQLKALMFFDRTLKFDQGFQLLILLVHRQNMAQYVLHDVLFTQVAYNVSVGLAT